MEFEVHYLKNNDFKTVQGNGVFGGITNTGQINMNFFTDRSPIPKKIVFNIDENTGKINDELSRESKTGLIREVHFGVILDINTAKSVRDWLTEKINQFEDQKKGIDE